MVLSHNYVDVQNLFVSLSNSGSDASFVSLSSPYVISTGNDQITVTNGAFNANNHLLYMMNGVLATRHTSQDVSQVFVNTTRGYFDPSFHAVSNRTWTFGNQTLTVTNGSLDATYGTLYVQQGQLDICMCVIDWSHNLAPITNTFYDVAHGTYDASQQTLTNYAITPHLTVTSGTMNGSRNLIYVANGTMDISSVSNNVSLTYTPLSNMFIMSDTTLPTGPSVPVTNYVVVKDNVTTTVNSGVVHTALGLVYVDQGVSTTSSTTTQTKSTPATNTFFDVSTGAVDAGSAIVVSNPYTMVNGSTTTTVTTGTLSSDKTVVYAVSGRASTSVPFCNVSHTYTPYSKTFINTGTGMADPSCQLIVGSLTTKNGAITASAGTFNVGKSLVYVAQGIRDQSAVSISITKTSTPYTNTFLTTSGASVAVDTGFVAVNNYPFTSGPGSICTVSSGFLNTTRSLIYVTSGQWDISSSTTQVLHTYLPVSSRFYNPLTGILDASSNALVTPWSYYTTDTSGRRITTTITAGFWNNASTKLYVTSGTQDISSSQWTASHTYVPVSTSFFNVVGSIPVMDGSAISVPFSWYDASNVLTVTSGFFSSYNNLVYIGQGKKRVSTSVVNVTHTIVPYTKTFVSSLTGQMDPSNVVITNTLPYVVSASGQIITVNTGMVNRKQQVLYAEQGQRDVSSTVTTANAVNVPISYTFMTTDTCIVDTTFVLLTTTYTFTGTNGYVTDVYLGYVSNARGLIYVGNGKTTKQGKATTIGNVFLNAVTGNQDATFVYTTPIQLSNGQNIVLSGGLYSATYKLVYVGYGLLNGVGTTVQHAYTDISNIVIHPVTGATLSTTPIASSTVFNTTGGLATVTSGLSLSSANLWYVTAGSLDVSNTTVTWTTTDVSLSNVLYSTITQLPSSLVPQTTPISYGGNKILTMSGEWYSPTVAYFTSGIVDISSTKLVASNAITSVSNVVWDVCLNSVNPTTTLTASQTTMTRQGIMTVTTGIGNSSSWYIASGTLDVSNTQMVPQHTYSTVTNQMVKTGTGLVDATFQYTPSISLNNGQYMTLTSGLWSSQSQLMYVGSGVLDVSYSVSTINHTYTNVSNIVVDLSYGIIQNGYQTLSPSVLSTSAGLLTVSGGWINPTTNSAYISSGTLDISNTVAGVTTTGVDVSGVLLDVVRGGQNLLGQPITQVTYTVSGGTWLVQNGIKVPSRSTVYVSAGVMQSVYQQPVSTSLPLSNVILNQGIVDPSFTSISNANMYNRERHVAASAGLRNNQVWYVTQGVLDVSSTTQVLNYTQNTFNNVVLDASGHSMSFQNITSPNVWVNGYKTLTTTTGMISVDNSMVFVSTGQCDTAIPVVSTIHTPSAQTDVFWDTGKGCVDTSFLPKDGYQLVYDPMHKVTGNGWVSTMKGLVWLRSGTYDVSYATPIQIALLGPSLLDVSNLSWSACAPVDVSSTVDTSFGTVIVTRGWKHANPNILFVENGVVDVVPRNCISCGTISVADTTNNVVLSLPCSAFNAKLGIFKTTTTPVTLVHGSTIQQYYNPILQCFVDAQSMPVNQIQFGSNELFVSLTSPSNIVSIGTFASVYQNFVAFLASYLQLYRTSHLLNIQQVVSTALRPYQWMTPDTLWNILKGSGDTSGNILSGSVTLGNINCLLQKACDTNPFGNRGPTGKVNALDTHNPTNYQPWDGFLPGDMVSVPQFNLTLNVNVDTIKAFIDPTATHTTTQTQNVTHTVNCPLIIVLY